MQQRLLRALAVFACVASPGCFNNPVASAPISPSSVYGNAVWGNFVGNHTIGGSMRAKVALRGKAPFAGCFDRFETYFIAAPSNTGYSKGDGGDIRVSIQTLNASDVPSGTVVGAPVTYSPRLSNGALASGQTVAGTLFPELRFPSAACLTAGQKFAIVFENVDPDPVNNYMGVNTLGVSMPTNSPVLDPIWSTYMQGSGGSWFKRVWSNESHVPIFRLCTSAGACIAQTYMETAGARTIGGTARARQLMRPSTTVTIRSCTLTLARTSSSATSVRIGIATTSGTYLNGGSAYTNVNISSLPVQTGTYQVSQVRATFPAAVTLTAGVQYALVISSPTSGGVRLAPVKDGSSYFVTNSSFEGSTSRAQYSSDGSSWSDWSYSYADLQFYCQP